MPTTASSFLDEPAAPTASAFLDDGQSAGAFLDESPYSTEGIAASRQALEASEARRRQLREEADIDALSPKVFAGIRKPSVRGTLNLLTGGLVDAPPAPTESDYLIQPSRIPGEAVALGSEALKSFPSVAAGAAAASKAMPLANRLGAIPGPVGVASRFGVPLLAGGAGAITERLAQDAMLPKILPENLQNVYEDTGAIAAQNPNSAMVGQFLGAAPLFRPGLPIGTTGGARLTTPLVTGGIGAGIEGAQQLAEGEFDPQRLAMAGVGQALLNRETRLGQRIAPNLVLPQIEPRATAGDKAKLAQLTERMAGKTPEQQLDVVRQEMQIQKDTLTPNQERAGLEIEQGLEQTVAAQKAQEAAAKEAEKVAKAQQKAAQDIQKAQAQDAANAQKAQAEAMKPPEIPKSQQILSEAATPPALANVATEIGTQTSPFALQGKLNELTAGPAQIAPPAELAAPVAAKTPGVANITEAPAAPVQTKSSMIKAAVADPATEWQFAVQRDASGKGGFVQVDAISRGENTVSSNVADLNKAGAKLPEVPDWVPQGRYTLPELEAIIKQGEPKNAIPKQIPDAVDVRQSPENGPPVGEGNVRAQEAPGNQVREGQVQEALTSSTEPPPLEAVNTRELRLNNADIDLPPVSSMTRAQKRAELDAAGVTEYNGKPLDDANPAEISNAVGKLRRGQLNAEPADIIDTLQARKRLPKRPRGELPSAGPDLLFDAAHDAALDVAIAGIRAGRTLAEIIRSAIARFRNMHKNATPEQLAALEADIREAHTGPNPRPSEADALLAAAPNVEPVAGRAEDATQQASRMRGTRGAITVPGGPKQTETPAFKKWFGDSKVVDAEGKPLVVYHGTTHDITEPDGLFWTTPSKRSASEFADRQAFSNQERSMDDFRDADQFSAEYDDVAAAGQNVMPSYVRMKNPLDLTELGQTSTLNEMSDYLAGKKVMERLDDDILEEIAMELSTEDRNYTPRSTIPTYRILEALDAYPAIKSAGHDGVKITDTNVRGHPIEAWASFDPAQIKSAIGNRGTFDPMNPDIRAAINPQAAASLAGAPVGGAIGYATTDREPGETDEAYHARQLRNTLLGAAGGAAAGLSIASMARADAARRGNRYAPKQEGITQVPTPPEGQGVRQTAEKIIENRNFPKRMREALANDPGIFYDQFGLNAMKDRVKGTPQADLVNMMASGDTFERLSATAELANRYAVSSDPAEHAQAAILARQFAENMTTPAQLINLGKLIESPDTYVEMVRHTLSQVKRDLTPAQQSALVDLKRNAIRADKAMDTASAAARADFSAANEQARKQAVEAAAKAELAVDKYVQRLAPDSWGDILSKTIKGNLLTLKSLVQNPFGNLVFQPVNRGARAIASTLDAFYSKASGKPYTLAELNPIPSTLEAKAFWDGTKIAAKELLTGPGVDSYAKAEIQKGFEPIRSFVQAFTGKGMAVKPDGTVAMNDRLKRLFEGSPMAANAEAMFRFLNLGDKGFRRSEEMRVLISQAKLKGLKGREFEKFLAFPDKATQNLIETEGRHAIFAQDNKGVRTVNAVLDHALADALDIPKDSALRDVIKVAATTVAPYRQFPVNYVINSANYALPAVGFARAIKAASQGNRRAAFINTGEATMGLMMYGGAAWLWKHGLISEPFSKDPKERTAQYANMGPARINISGMNRAMNGGDGRWQPGDDTRSWEGIGVPSFVFSIYTDKAAKRRGEAARTAEPSRNKPVDGFGALNPLESFPGFASAALDQSFLAGVNGFLDAMKDPDDKLDRWSQNTFRAVSSIAVPNNMEAFARAQYQYIPELRGDTAMESWKNIWNFKTLQLPKDERAMLKRGIWGDPIERTVGDKNPYVDQFMDVTKSQKKDLDPVGRALYAVFQQTDSPDVYPAIPGRTISVGGTTVELTPEAYDRYQQYVGEARRKFVEMVVSNPRFSEDSVLPEQKILALKEAYSAGAQAGKQQLLQGGADKEYFPDLMGLPVTPFSRSRIRSRDPEARGRVRMREGK